MSPIAKGGKNNQLNKNQKNKNNHPFKAMIEVKFASKLLITTSKQQCNAAKNLLGSKDLGFYVFRILMFIVGKP